jgi:hypothetical protein
VRGLVIDFPRRTKLKTGLKGIPGQVVHLRSTPTSGGGSTRATQRSVRQDGHHDAEGTKLRLAIAVRRILLDDLTLAQVEAVHGLAVELAGRTRGGA